MAQSAATAYLEKHNIQKHMQDAVNAMLKQKPDDPFYFLSQSFAALSTALQAENNNNKQSSHESTELSTKDSKNAKPAVVFVLGGPGAGKGTQCANIVKEYGFVHLSAGDLLREERQNPNSQHGQLIDAYIREGKIVPVEITVELIKHAMQKSRKPCFLVDGFPRNEDNLEGWKNVIGDGADVKFVLFFDCPEQVMEERLLERGKTSGRADDNAESVRKRFKTYIESTLPIIEHFQQQGKVRHIDASKTIAEVYADVRIVFDKEFPDFRPIVSS